MKQQHPRQILDKLVNKNAIKRKIGASPQAIFPETLDPPPPPLWILAKTSSTPLDFWGTQNDLKKLRGTPFFPTLQIMTKLT
jgi:hypothetical protein